MEINARNQISPDVGLGSCLLIQVGGICGAGKSTTTREISRLLRDSSIPHRWLHEESRNHPLRITKKDQAQAKGSSTNDYIEWSLSHWRSFIRAVLEDRVLRLIDGYVFQSTILNLILAKTPEKYAFDFFIKWARLVEELNPVIVFLHKSNIKASFESIWPQRGDRWKRISTDAPQNVELSEEEWGYYESQGLKAWQEIQELYHRLFRQAPGNSISIDTTDCAWNEYLQSICRACGIAYFPRPENSPATINVEGDYARIGSDEAVIHIKSIAGKPYCKSFWPRMDMIHIKDTTYEIRSFPITLTFAATESAMAESVHITGGYHWDLDGEMLYRLPAT